MTRRVLICGMNYAPELAGVGRYTGEIGEHLAKLGHNVRVITTPAHYPGWRALNEYSGSKYLKEELDGAIVYRCPLYLHPEMKGFRRLLAPLTFALSSAPVVIYQALKHRPHVVLGVEPTLFAAPATLLAAKLVGAKTALHVQDLEVDAAFAVGHLNKRGLAMRAAALFEQVTMKLFHRVITISSRMAEKIEEKGVAPDRIRIIRNWVDVQRVRPQSQPSSYRAELGLTEKDFVVLYSGAIGAKQGVGLLLDAADRLADRPDIVFVIAGDGPMRATLETASHERRNFRVLPFQPEARFNDFLALADVHVLPQERGAADLVLPSKLGGMLASGRRVVVTAEPGTELADFLAGSCVLTPPGDGAALAEALRAEAGVTPSKSSQSARLALAHQLSKAEVIEQFCRTVLFEDA